MDLQALLNKFAGMGNAQASPTSPEVESPLLAQKAEEEDDNQDLSDTNNMPPQTKDAVQKLYAENDLDPQAGYLPTAKDMKAKAVSPSDDDYSEDVKKVVHGAPSPAPTEAAQDDDSDEDESPVKKLLSPAEQKMASVRSMLEAMFPEGLRGSDLKTAQQHRDDQRQRALMGMAGQTFSSAFTHQKADNSFYDQMLKDANLGVDDVVQGRKAFDDSMTQQDKYQKLLTEQDRNSPDSPVSKAAGALLKKYYPDLDVKGLSAAAVEKIMPNFVKDHAADINALLNEAKRTHKDEKDDRKVLMNQQDKLQSETKKINEGIDALSTADTIADEAAKGNGTARNQLRTLLARVSTGGQRLNTAEIVSSGGSSDMAASVERLFNNAETDHLTDQDYREAKSLISAYRKVASQALTDKENKRIKLAGSVLPNMSESDLRSKLGAAPMAPASPAPDSDTVQVVSPQGKVGTIPKANLQKALDRGFKVQ